MKDLISDVSLNDLVKVISILAGAFGIGSVGYWVTFKINKKKINKKNKVRDISQTVNNGNGYQAMGDIHVE